MKKGDTVILRDGVFKPQDDRTGVIESVGGVADNGSRFISLTLEDGTFMRMRSDQVTLLETPETKGIV